MRLIPEVLRYIVYIFRALRIVKWRGENPLETSNYVTGLLGFLLYDCIGNMTSSCNNIIVIAGTLNYHDDYLHVYTVVPVTTTTILCRIDIWHLLYRQSGDNWVIWYRPDISNAMLGLYVTRYWRSNVDKIESCCRNEVNHSVYMTDIPPDIQFIMLWSCSLWDNREKSM